MKKVKKKTPLVTVAKKFLKDLKIKDLGILKIKNLQICTVREIMQ